MFTPQLGDDIDILDVSQILDSFTGTGWSSGAAPSLVDQDDALEIEITSGTVRVDGDTVTTTSQSVTLPVGDADWPRKDVVYVDANGDLQRKVGIPRPPRPEKQTARRTTQPSPPDLVGTTGVPVAEVWVPARAEGAPDLDDPRVTYVTDRRVSIISSQSTSADHGDLSGLSDDDHPQYLPVDGTRTATTKNIADDAITTAKEAPSAIQAAPNLAMHVLLEPNGADADGDEYHSPVHVPDGATLNVYMVGVCPGDGSSPPSGLEAELNDAAKSQIAGPVNSRHATGDPLWSVTNSSGSTSTFFISVDNDTSNDYTQGGSTPSGVTLTAAYRVE